MSGFSGLLDPPNGASFIDYLRTWSDTHVARWLADIKCSAHIETFQVNDIRGDILLELDQDMLKEMRISSVGDRLRIMTGVKALRTRCSPRTSSPPMTSISQIRTYFSPYGETRALESPREPPKVIHPSHSRDNSRDSPIREPSPTSRAPKRLENNRPAPLVLSPSSGRGDLPRLIREPHSGDSARHTPAIRPLPQPVSNGGSTQSTAPNGAPSSARPSLPPLPPAPRVQPPQPPTSQQSTTRTTTRNLHPLVGPRARTPNQADATPYANSPLPPAPAGSSQIMLTPLSGNASSNGWSPYGLPSDPRSGSANLKPPMRSPSPLNSRPSPRPTNSAAHNRNISFGGLGSPLGVAPPSAKLPPRPSTTGTSPHPYASAQPHPSQSLQTPVNQTGPVLSPIIEAFMSGPTSPSSSSPPAAFTVGRGPFNPPSHNTAFSLDDLRRKLVKFILPDEGRSCVVDITDCAGGIEVMEKVLRKLDKVAARATNLMNRVDTDDGGLSVDGWCVYLEWDEQQNDGM
jgi:mitogen-activated protein kinase kinase kinase